ncbi:DUF982 domain-containing protein [Salipiger sp. HF18]|uniref:DUF982 domain-containing protein n=1 Tax=Salipiger sp. HF18 TaxID=2721557 RepID=UPI000C374BB2|nr:DUF982 domain-containing protein [Salipiger sp. HF18]MAU43861.1 hypothetical protein [Salipiger sp.]NIY96988.1 DUF982 domain-containing protein [Salipiger sp. HF18]|tara:strand:- start:208 stop:459 length:252 start_codon:yes stop_codon:yes gene_type:complete
MMEIQWGQPVVLMTSQNGDTEHFSTIEKVRYWLRRRWPISDGERQVALTKVESAMDCMSPVEDARRAFLVAARSAGFIPATLV